MTAGDLRRHKEKAALGLIRDTDGRVIPSYELEEWMQSDGWVKGDGSNLNPTVESNPTHTDEDSLTDEERQRVDTAILPAPLTPILSDEERERAQIQGNTGASVARSTEQNNVDTLNGNKNNQNNNSGIEANSELMWENPDGRTISVSEYKNILRMSGMENHDYDAWLEAQGFRRADNSNTMPPKIVDHINGTTPTAMQAQVAHLNGDDNNFTLLSDNSQNFQNLPFGNRDFRNLPPSPHAVYAPYDHTVEDENGNDFYPDNNAVTTIADRARTPLNTLFNFMSESPSINEAIRQKYPNSHYPNDENGYDYHPDNDSPPDDYNPYDPNYPQPQPYSPDDTYERGFEFDDDNNKNDLLERGNGDFQMLPLVNYGNNDNNNMTLLATRRNPRRKNQTRTTRVAPQRKNYPQRSPRKPGQIIPNTSYDILRNEVDSSARRHGVDPELVRAIIQIESRWDSNALSSAGARGLMQLMPGTARDLGVRDSYNPAQNIEGGTKFIARLIRKYKGDVAKALMAYNTGPGNVDKGNIPQVTKKYARNVMAIYNRLKSRRG